MATKCQTFGIDFKFIYIAEAHADSEWPIGNQFIEHLPPFPQTTTLKERKERALKFQSDFKLFDLPIFIDDPETNAFQKVFTPWPLRWYVLIEGVCQLVSEPKDGFFDLKFLVDFLKPYLK